MSNDTTTALPDAAPQDALKGRWQLDDIQPAAVLDLHPHMDKNARPIGLEVEAP